jgi:hypothetical protein
VDIAAAGLDPKKLYYLDNGLTEEQFATDAAAGVCIVTLQAGALSTVYVPSSFIDGIPATGGVPYTQLLMAVDLGALPNTTDLTYLSTQVADLVQEQLGIAPPSVHLIVASPTTIVTDEQHAIIEAARLAAIETVTTERAKRIAAETQLADVQTRNLELVTYIQSLNLPASLIPPAAILAVDHETDLLEVGNTGEIYWLADGVVDVTGLVRDSFTDINGVQYEQHLGVSDEIGVNGEVAVRLSWGYPHVNGSTVKAYPSLIAGAKPGWYSTGYEPAGLTIVHQDGTSPTGAPGETPSGATPGTIFPLQLPLTNLHGSYGHRHNVPSTGQGLLAYDFWFQSSPEQRAVFNADGEVTNEVVIVLDYWGGYGAYGTRSPGWYVRDAIIDGLLWHVYVVKNEAGELEPYPVGSVQGWKRTVFQPAAPISRPGNIDFAAFFAYMVAQQDSAGTPWLVGTEYLVSAELGVEVVEGTGDVTIHNYRVYQAP